MNRTIAEAALDSAEDAIITVDATGHITSWNPAAQTVFGHSADEAIGQTLALIIPAEHRARHMAGFHHAMDSGNLTHEGRPARVIGTKADGAHIDLEMTLGVIDGENDAPSGVVAVLRRGATEPISFVP